MRRAYRADSSLDDRTHELLGLDDIATMAGVSLPAVTQWRKKKGSDFPAPLPSYETLVFR